MAAEQALSFIQDISGKLVFPTRYYPSEVRLNSLYLVVKKPMETEEKAIFQVITESLRSTKTRLVIFTPSTEKRVTLYNSAVYYQIDVPDSLALHLSELKFDPVAAKGSTYSCSTNNS